MTSSLPPATDATSENAKRSAHSERILVLEPGRAERNYWTDLWYYRELLVILALRDISVRYKQTVIGVGWALIRPLLTTIVFTVIFERVANLPSEGAVPYPVMVFAGMLPWFMISSVLTEASNSLITNANLISKVYFPRLLIPLATAAVAVVDFLINLLMLILLMLWFGHAPSWHLVFLPAAIIFALAVALGPALWISALNVKYRDFRYVIPFIVQIGLYVSPVGFSISAVPEEWRLLLSLNPVVGVIDSFRWCLLGGQSQLGISGLITSMAVMALLLWYGVRYFRATERTFADMI